MPLIADDPPLRDDVLNEVRFAVVIYGGVSLAIYINGIAQEMLRMVRATAGNVDASELKFSELTYRKLGQLLGNPDHRPVELAQILTQDAPVRTRFVIDILSGTSAGGINAIFLGKALVNNQSLSGLEQLWITQGNIESLINDRKSLTSRLRLQHPPRSLLNSSRMYQELLSALDEMDNPKGRSKATAPSGALVENVDLFTTATDLSGLTVAMTLADGVVTEKRHRNVFHFQYDETDAAGSSSFAQSENPFLAFAARCTSAFPFAFEPMELNDIFPVLISAPDHRGKDYCKPDTQQWQRYYKNYLGAKGETLPGQPFSVRAFGDGGYLDNKPFSYAIETMLTRHAGLPVTRKLVYIEPNPEDPPPDPLGENRPNAIENSLAALMVLPRYEAIREDLERVVTRNLQIEQIGRVVDSVKAVLIAPTSGAKPEVWYKTNELGGGYATYERLKLSTVTDDLANLISPAFGIDVRSAYGTAIRTLSSEWRELEYPSPEDRRRFLLKFNVKYRLRRIRQLWRRIQAEYYEPSASVAAADRSAYRTELQQIKHKLRQPYLALQRLIHQPIFNKADIDQGVFSLEELELVVEPPADIAAWEKLSDYPWVGERSNRGSRKRADFVLQALGKRARVTMLAEKLAEGFKGIMIEASDRAIASFADGGPSMIEAAKAARTFVRLEYEAFEKYDSAAFPITFGTDVDDSRAIDIHRISPKDAVQRSSDILEGREKLRGQLLGAFGGFLDATWRSNDILWGRLDGAERLITMVLPEPDAATVSLRSDLIDEAHEHIVVEVLKLTEAERPNWKRHLREFIQQVPTAPEPELVARSAARVTAVVGDLLGGISSQQSNPAKHLLQRVALAGRLAWSLVEVSVPRSPLELFGTYWLQLLMLLSLLLVIIAVIFSGTEGLWKLAGILLVASILLYLGRETLRRYLRGEFVPSFPLLASVTIGVVAVLTALASQLQSGTASAWSSTMLLSDSIGERWHYLLDKAATLPFLQWDHSLILASLLMVAGSGVATIGASKRARQLRQPINVVKVLKSAKSWHDVYQALGTTDRATRASVTRAIRADVVFASAYGLFFVAFAANWLLGDDSRSVIMLSAGAAAGCGLAAALASIASDNAAFKLAQTPLPIDLNDPLPHRPFFTRRAKQVLLILACGFSLSLWLL